MMWATSLLLLLSSSATVVGQLESIVQLHGSGTTNPSKCYWHIMDTFHQQSKLPIRMTYRAVGSGTGQKEFIGAGIKGEGNATGTLPDNDFGSGDIPISSADYQTLKDNGVDVLHFPIVAGSISFFHSVPTGNAPLNLTACNLAKIFKQSITDWNDQEIKDVNPNLNIADPSPIRIAHRKLGSSSTASITEYLNVACPSEWPEEMVGKVVDWPADSDTVATCQGSGGMTKCITEKSGTIGYIDSGHGHSVEPELAEVHLENKDNTFLSSKQAAENGGIISALNNADIPTSLDGNFGEVSLLNQAGTNTWPIVALSYIYVRKDLTFMPAQSQTLLKAFLLSLYNEEYITRCEDDFGFVRVTGPVRDEAIQAITGNTLITSASAPTWTFESAGDTIPHGGQNQYVLSGKRQSYSEVEQANVIDDVTTLTEDINALKNQNLLLLQKIEELQGHGHSANGLANSANNGDYEDVDSIPFTEQDETQITAALVMSSLSFVMCLFAMFLMLNQLYCSPGKSSTTHTAGGGEHA